MRYYVIGWYVNSHWDHPRSSYVDRNGYGNINDAHRARSIIAREVPSVRYIVVEDEPNLKDLPPPAKEIAS